MADVKLTHIGPAEKKIASIDTDADFDPKHVSAPTNMDGSPVDKEEAARVHAGLISGEIGIEVAPEAVAEMEAIGLSVDQFREMLIAATKKTMS